MTVSKYLLIMLIHYARHDMKVVTDQHLPSSLWAESAPLGEMSKVGFWAIGETNSCSQWCNNQRVMRLSSKSE